MPASSCATLQPQGWVCFAYVSVRPALIHSASVDCALLACCSGLGQEEDLRRQQIKTVTALCFLLDTTNSMTSAHFLHGAPGSRAHSACLAVISAAVCFNQQVDEHCEWEGADAAAWELVLGRVLPRLRDLQGLHTSWHWVA
jgi:hypothetical protein